MASGTPAPYPTWKRRPRTADRSRRRRRPLLWCPARHRLMPIRATWSVSISRPPSSPQPLPRRPRPRPRPHPPQIRRSSWKRVALPTYTSVPLRHCVAAPWSRSSASRILLDPDSGPSWTPNCSLASGSTSPTMDASRAAMSSNTTLPRMRWLSRSQQLEMRWVGTSFTNVYYLENWVWVFSTFEKLFLNEGGGYSKSKREFLHPLDTFSFWGVDHCSWERLLAVLSTSSSSPASSSSPSPSTSWWASSALWGGEKCVKVGLAAPQHAPPLFWGRQQHTHAHRQMYIHTYVSMRLCNGLFRAYIYLHPSVQYCTIYNCATMQRIKKEKSTKNTCRGSHSAFWHVIGLRSGLAFLLVRFDIENPSRLRASSSPRD